MSPWFMAVMVLALISLSGMVVVTTAGAGNRRLAKRAKRIGARGEPTQVKAGPRLSRQTSGSLDALAMKILPQPAIIRQRLQASGMSLSIGGYATACGCVAMAAMLLMMVFAKAPPPLALMNGLFAGLCLPHFFLGSRIKARRKKFGKLFPDAIGLMVRGLRAGLPITESIIVVGRECIGPVGEEFRRVADQVRLGQSLEDAMWAVAKRLELPEFNFLVITFSIQRETGGNLADTLQNLDNMLRMRSQMKLKVKAMSSEAIATACIIGCLPFAMGGLMFLVSRDYIMMLFTTPLGEAMVAGAAVWLSIGIFIMSQMVSFEI
jgi:tight adherence protein B